MSDYIPIEGCIYLLKLCDTSQRIIYKVGKSINFYKRFSKYNYAEILMFIRSDDITQDENKIINIFNINCKLDRGREFFLAKDDCFVLNLFINYFNSKNNRNIITSNTLVNTENRISESMNIINTIENISIDNIVNANIEIVTDNNTNIVDYVCPNINCNKKFNYCSYLKKHLLNSYHCNKSIDNIDLYFIEIDKIKKNNVIKTTKEYKCSNCKNNYKNNFTLQRHMNTSKCNIIIKQNILLHDLEIIQTELNNLV